MSVNAWHGTDQKQDNHPQRTSKNLLNTLNTISCYGWLLICWTLRLMTVPCSRHGQAESRELRTSSVSPSPLNKRFSKVKSCNRWILEFLLQRRSSSLIAIHPVCFMARILKSTSSWGWKMWDPKLRTSPTKSESPERHFKSVQTWKRYHPHAPLVYSRFPATCSRQIDVVSFDLSKGGGRRLIPPCPAIPLSFVGGDDTACEEF